MRTVYLALKFVLKYALWIFYPRTRVVNKPKKRFARTIYASNHAASFMDPLVVASNQSPIVFFMTRSDVFTTLLKPILWAAHMLPIYRSHDGEDTKIKNEQVFRKCSKILKYGRSLLIFSEGFTDDEFIRRLKPIKKGSIRIGFGALESMNWNKQVFVQAVGVNYSDPNVLGSEVVISNGEPICLNDFKEDYLNNPNKVINELTKELEIQMQDQLTHVEKHEWAPFHENIMRLTRKGMSPFDSDKSIPLLKRWKYSKELAKWMNTNSVENNSQILQLRDEMKDYFQLLQEMQLKESDVHKMASGNHSKFLKWIYLVMVLPMTIVGLIHNFPGYYWVKPFVEKSFKRKVFWGSVKLLLGAFVIGVYNVVLISCIHLFLIPSFWFWMMYFFCVPPITGVIAYDYFKNLKEFRRIRKMEKVDLSTIFQKRLDLIKKISDLIPVA